MIIIILFCVCEKRYLKCKKQLNIVVIFGTVTVCIPIQKEYNRVV